MKIKLIVAVRPLRWMFIRHWYSFYRWTHPQDYENRTYRLVDIGSITIGFSKIGKRYR